MRRRVGLVCLLGLSGMLSGANLYSQEAVESSDIALEEIVVMGERSRTALRFQMERQQDEIYRLFNQLLDDRDYKVRCNSTPATGTYIPKRHCEPAFLANERARYSAQTMAAWRSGEDPAAPTALAMEMALSSGRASDSDLQFDLAKKYEDMNQEMYDLAMSNPNLLEALTRLAVLQADFRDMIETEKSASKAKKGKGLFCGLFSSTCKQDN